VTRIAKVIHEILTDDFKPLNLRVVAHQIRKVLVTQTNAQAKSGKSQTWALDVLHLKG
jgi:uncharacterized protein (UPF0147 family)